MTDISKEAVERPAYLIRKSGAYYRPNSQGYTNSAIQAGRYTLDEALDISHPNGPKGPRDNMTFIHEDEVGCEDWTAYRAQAVRIAELEAALEEIAFMGFDMPATLEMTDDAWRRRRTGLMQHRAKQALASKEADNAVSKRIQNRVIVW